MRNSLKIHLSAFKKKSLKIKILDLGICVEDNSNFLYENRAFDL